MNINKPNEQSVKELEKITSEMGKQLRNLLNKFYDENSTACCIIIDSFVESHIENKMKMNMECIQSMIEKAKSGKVH